MINQTTHDEEIIDLLHKQDERAIELLFDRFYEYLCGVVFKILHDYEAARDVVQDLFFELWKKRGSLVITSALRPYLRKAALNRSINYLNKQRILHKHESNMSEEIQYVQPSGQLNLEHEDLEQRIFIAIDKLPTKCKVIFSMSRFENMSYKEIASSLEISIKTVENQISKALKILRHEVHNHDN